MKIVKGVLIQVDESDLVNGVFKNTKVLEIADTNIGKIECLRIR